jgi:hypothetical protein
LGSFKLEQRRVTHRGREFHFVSYEGQVANAARKQMATDPTWFLINAGKRWPVFAHQPAQEPDELDRQLAEWLERNVFA